MGAASGVRVRSSGTRIRVENALGEVVVIDVGTADIGTVLGHAFRQPALLLEALTHRSFRNENKEVPSDNERLEFLGDAILGAAVSDLLMLAHPAATEGTMTRYKAALVSEPALAEAARRFGLGRHIRLGRGEERSGGRAKASVLANTVEALVAAVYLDAGFMAARAVVQRLVEDRFDRVGRTERKSDYKTRLQEHLQNERRATPLYRIVAELGPDHERQFTAEVFVADEVLGRGEGASKKRAEQAAAKGAFRRMQEQAGYRADMDSTEFVPRTLLGYDESTDDG